MPEHPHRLDTVAFAPIPEQSEALVARHLQQIEGLAAEGLQREHLSSIAAMSDFIGVSLAQDAGLLDALSAGPLWSPRCLDDYSDLVSACLARAGNDEASLLRELRCLRRAEMVRIAWRDLAGLNASTAETLRELTDFAQACVAGVVYHAQDLLAQRFGQPRTEQGEVVRLMALGMGKLGGEELNFSSDIDLIFVFSENGQTDGGKPVDNQQFFVKVSQLVIKLLDQPTADGFVFRVDMRLRPFGSSGPLAISMAGLEGYLETQGREWERYAMVKARPLCGDAADRAALEQTLHAFVYRRYLDYGAIESLRDLKTSMMSEMQRRGLQHCVKLGLGGIREIEFIAQSFQLVRGGHESVLRQRALRPVLRALGELQLLDTEEVAFLESSYDVLRRLENRLQMMADQQTHALPEQDLAQQRIAYAMGFSQWSDLLDMLKPLRERVHSIFRDVFSVEEAEQAESANQTSSTGVWGEQNQESVLAFFESAGFADAAASARLLHDVRFGGFYVRLSSKAQERLDKLMPMLLDQVALLDAPDVSFTRVMAIVRMVAGRNVYLQALLDNPHALTLLLRLCASSGLVATFIAEQPQVLDELLTGEVGRALPDRAQMETQALSVLEGVASDDLEQQMERLRQFKNGMAMRIAIADVLTDIPLMQVSDHLAWLAESVLTVSLNLVTERLIAKHGKPVVEQNGERQQAQLVVVAYGKLGGLELGYSSDLDVVFLHDSPSSEQSTDGDKPLDHRVFFARVVQSLTHFLSARTPGGQLYELDTRLRPNGRGGMLVSSLEAFERYQRNDAWVWEHQALTRARVVVGVPELVESFQQIRAQVLCEAVNTPDLRKQVSDMRDRMIKELDRSASDTFDLKQSRGGIADIEFMVQYSVMVHAAQVPDVLTVSDNTRQLQVLASAGVMPADDAQTLIDAYLSLRARTHACALQGKNTVVGLDHDLVQLRDQVASIWQRLMHSEQ